MLISMDFCQFIEKLLTWHLELLWHNVKIYSNTLQTYCYPNVFWAHLFQFDFLIHD